MRKTAHFDIRNLVPINYVQAMKTPCCFVKASTKDFIRPKCTEQLYSKYGGEKKCIHFEGTQHAKRPDSVIQQAYEFASHHHFRTTIAGTNLKCEQDEDDKHHHSSSRNASMKVPPDSISKRFMFRRKGSSSKSIRD